MADTVARALILLILWASASAVRAQEAQLTLRPEIAEQLQERSQRDSALSRWLEDRPLAVSDAVAPVPDETRVPIALPSGTAQSAVTPQAVSLPQAEGSVEGMGESFSAQLASGAATYRVPLAVPQGRAGVEPSISLSYSSAAGNGTVGFGWALGVPFIARQTDRGLPRYVDREAWHPEEDRFVYGGSQELVPVSDTSSYDGAPVTDTEVAGWQQYRAQVEGAFLRVFRSPDSRRWIVHDRAGSRYEFGELPSSQGPPDLDSSLSLLSEAGGGEGAVHTWYLTRQSDAHGSTIHYGYFAHAGQRYLETIHYTSPRSCEAASARARRECDAPLSQYGRRVRLIYEAREDAYTSYTATWPVTTALRLKRVEMTAVAGASVARTLVRRYHLRYHADRFHSLLESVQLEGRPDAFDASVQVHVGDASWRENDLSDVIVGRLLPAVTFAYSRAPGTTSAVAGFGGIDAQVYTSSASPPHSVDEARSDLFDVNGDGLPDLIVTDPARYRTADGSPAVGVFFNGFLGPNAAPAHPGAFSDAIPVAIPAGLSSALSLGNGNIAPMDVDGDGRADLLHMPRRTEYGYFVVARDAGDAVSPSDQGWRFVHVPVALPSSAIDARIDWARERAHFRMLDVDNDHLVDIVRTTGTSMQTWRNLGWLAGGDGRFGSATFVGDGWLLDTAPRETCLPNVGTPLDFGHPETRLADMNGDGLQDVVRVRRGRVIYWPSRGAGQYGTGTTFCEGGGGAIEMTGAAEVDFDLAGVQFVDLDADGASDLVQVGRERVDVWFNRAGRGFTGRITERIASREAAFAPRVRIADIDASGTVDIVWATAGEWRWIDPMGGRRPRLLTQVDNGLGLLTTLEYGSSADDYLRDLREDGPHRWNHVRGECDARVQARSGECVYRSGGSPVVSTVVRAVESSDRFDAFGLDATVARTEYRFHDAYYEGIEQELRGFGAAETWEIGDAAHPTQITRTHFHQGRRPNAIAADRMADNPDEPLKGAVYLTEVLDTSGRYLSTTHVTHANVHLFDGLDGRAIRWALPVQTDLLRYDQHAPFSGTEAIELPSVRRYTSSGAFADTFRSVTVRGDGWAHLRTTVDEFDLSGHVIQSTAHGRVRGESGEPVPDERIISRSEPVRVEGSESGWMWRVGRSFVTGESGIRFMDTQSSYDAEGNRRRKVVSVQGVPSLEFSGDGDAESLTQTEEDLVDSSLFDAWGNITHRCAGGDLGIGDEDCLRYVELDYDAEYAQFPVRERTAAARETGFTFLTHRATWDRGLSTVTTTIDPNGYVSEVRRDGLGRTTLSRAPNVAGCEGSEVPSQRTVYDIPTDAGTYPVSIVHTTVDLDCAAVHAEVVESRVYVDGRGQARASLHTGDEAHTWVRGGVQVFTSRGSAERAYQDEYLDDPLPSAAAVLAIPTTPSVSTRFDAFGRPTVVRAEDGSATRSYFHALSTDACDPVDLDPASVHYGTCSTSRVDGHDRVIDQVLRNVQPDTGMLEVYRLFSFYRPDGAVSRLVRAQTPTSAPMVAGEVPTPIDGRQVERWFAVDSAGRRVGSTDADTDSRDPSATDANRTWRYLYNRVGDLAAVRDPRGCGQNFYYDCAGRLIGEAYVSCAEAQPSEEALYEVPAQSIGLDVLAAPEAVDVRLWFDRYPRELSDVATLPADAAGVLGRAVGRADRGQRSRVAYDPRGNVVWEARQLAFIPQAGSIPERSLEALPSVFDGEGAIEMPVEYDTLNTYERTATYDHAGRVRATQLPADPSWAAMGGTGSAPVIGGALAFNRRGLPERANVVIDGNVHPVIAGVTYLRDGMISRITHGDALPGHPATVSRIRYDARRRPVHAETVRSATAPTVPGSPALGSITTVIDQQLRWDRANNLVALIDHRDGGMWRAGDRPSTVRLQHDSLYRVVGAEYEYNHADGSATASDDGSDWRLERERVNADGGTHRSADPMGARPAQMTPSAPADRIVSATWLHDYLGNTVETTDDAHAFHERSLGAITNGGESGRPSAIRLATDLPTTDPGASDPGAERGGWLEVDYGVSGNVVAVTVHAQCSDAPRTTCFDSGGTLAARRDGLRTRCACAREQAYHYRYDELNRMAEARRYEFIDGAWHREVRQRYRYDSGNDRTIKQTLGAAGRERIAAYVYSGDFERRGLESRAGEASPTYVASSEAESQYLVAGARIVWSPPSRRRAGLDPEHRITFALTDLIQSTSAVIDLASGELVETATFYANGARESHWMQEEASLGMEPMGFTGKEADEEVGLVYFGQRYLMPHLGRWVTPDPLQVHRSGGGEALNNYHYISGNLLAGRDPIGLADSSLPPPAVPTEITPIHGKVLVVAPKGAAGSDFTQAIDAYKRNGAVILRVNTIAAVAWEAKREGVRPGSVGLMIVMSHGSFPYIGDDSAGFDIGGESVSLDWLRRSQMNRFDANARRLVGRIRSGGRRHRHLARIGRLVGRTGTILIQSCCVGSGPYGDEYLARAGAAFGRRVLGSVGTTDIYPHFAPAAAVASWRRLRGLPKAGRVAGLPFVSNPYAYSLSHRSEGANWRSSDASGRVSTVGSVSLSGGLNDLIVNQPRLDICLRCLD